NVLVEHKKNQTETNARYEEEQENLIDLLENISSENSEAKDTYNSLKNKQKELNAVNRELEEQLNVSDEAHDEKLEEIKNEYYTLM
ncbi:recombinase RecF, partial [Staphylococcus aureus]